MNRLNQAIDDVEKGFGIIITEDTKKILEQAKGYSFESIGNGQYLVQQALDAEGNVINEVESMIGAYLSIYETMKNTAAHTTADLNNLYAKLATAVDQQNIDIRDTLTNAFDVSYDVLAELINVFPLKNDNT